MTFTLLQALWSIEVSGGLSDDLAQQLLESPHDLEVLLLLLPHRLLQLRHLLVLRLQGRLEGVCAVAACVELHEHLGVEGPGSNADDEFDLVRASTQID